ncbi:MAG: amidohydrolase [Clostridiales bacterium]|jgi:amidohydrolase|nr:amidohydrolase [Clostridiales bacterium]
MDKKNLELVTELRHELHTHPELAGEEVWTKQRLIDFLSEHTSLKIVDRGAWFYAVYHSNSENPRRIGFRADFDALPIDETISLPYGSLFPGVAHKCGHDGHSATLVGFALEIDQTGSENDIYFIFQHGEEVGLGGPVASVIIDEEKIEEVYAGHNVPSVPENLIVIRDGPMYCASKGLLVYFEGTPSHASQPENGLNPAFEIAEVIRAIPSLAEPSLYKGLVRCTIICVKIGEETFGISASKGTLMLTIRAQFEDDMDQLQLAIENVCKEQAAIRGLKVRFEIREAFAETINNPEAAAKVRSAAARIGLSVYELEEPMRGSEDFGFFTKKTKGAGFMLGAGDRPQIHTVEYDFNDNIIEVGVEIFKELSR